MPNTLQEYHERWSQGMQHLQPFYELFRLNRTSGRVLSGLPAHIARLLLPLGMHFSEAEMEKPLNQDDWSDGPRGKR